MKDANLYGTISTVTGADIGPSYEEMSATIARLQKLNADMLAALVVARGALIGFLEVQIGQEVTPQDWSPSLIKVQNAIAKAKDHN